MKPKFTLAKPVETKEEVKQQEPEVTKAPEVELDEVPWTHEAISLVKNKFDEWQVVTIKFNPSLDRISNKYEVVGSGIDKFDAMERLKIVLIERGIF